METETATFSILGLVSRTLDVSDMSTSTIIVLRFLEGAINIYLLGMLAVAFQAVWAWLFAPIAYWLAFLIVFIALVLHERWRRPAT